METFQTTVEKVFDALEKNGLEHLRGTWFRSEWDEKTGEYITIGGCVLGQAAVNLGAYQDENEATDQFTLFSALSKLGITPGRWWENIDAAERDGMESVAQQIIYWNDATNDRGNFRLKTYAEVINMAKEVLTPYFDQTITLGKYDWKVPANA